MAADGLCLESVGKGVPELLDEGKTWERILQIASYAYIRRKVEAEQMSGVLGQGEEPGTKQTFVKRPGLVRRGL